MISMKVIVASDHGGYNLKTAIVSHLKEKGIDVKDGGPNSTEAVDYPDYAKPVDTAVQNGEYDHALLVCGTGIGHNNAANKHKGSRTQIAHDSYSAHETRKHKISNILNMGGRLIGTGLRLDILDIWLNTEFEG